MYLNLKKNKLVKETNVKEPEVVDMPEVVDIVYEAAHDLKGSIRTIKSFTQLLNSSLNDRFSEDEKGLVGFILEATYNLENLVAKLIDYSKAGLVLNIDEFKIDNLLQLVVLENRNLIKEKKATVLISCDENLVVNADKSKLKILFENLLSNSLKFISKTELPEIKINVLENIDNIKICFIDNGIGISKNKIPIAFELFERIHGTTDYEGSRVGLAICKRIAEVHGGAISINSEFDKFTEVNFTLPKKNSN